MFDNKVIKETRSVIVGMFRFIHVILILSQSWNNKKGKVTLTFAYPSDWEDPSFKICVFWQTPWFLMLTCRLKQHGVEMGSTPLLTFGATAFRRIRHDVELEGHGRMLLPEGSGQGHGGETATGRHGGGVHESMFNWKVITEPSSLIRLVTYSRNSPRGLHFHISWFSALTSMTFWSDPKKISPTTDSKVLQMVNII